MPDHAVTDRDFEIIRKKCDVFNEWCDKVGIRSPKLEYPAFFGNGLLGSRVTTPIEHREAFLFVPFKAMISVDKALRDPEMGDFYEKNPQLFTKDVNQDWEQLILCTYLMHQKALGEKSFWAPYIDLMPKVTFFAFSSAEAIISTMETDLIRSSLEYREELSNEWVMVAPVM